MEEQTTQRRIWDTREFERRIAFLERNMKGARLATAAELEAVASRSKEWADPERLLYHWADLRTLLHERNQAPAIDPDALDAATAAMEERPEYVTLHSVNKVIAVRPASFERITLIERLDYNLRMLIAARAWLMDEREKGGRSPEAREPCTKCKRPFEPDKAFALIDEFGREGDFTRAKLYAQVMADGPQPHEGELPRWANRITVGEHFLVLQAYHRVNSDPIRRLGKLVSSDGQRELPMSWAFLFVAQAEREHRPVKELMKDRSLASIVAVCVTSHINRQEMERKAREKAEAAKVHKGHAQPRKAAKAQHPWDDRMVYRGQD